MKENAGQRKIKRAWHSQPTIEGAGVHLNRAFGFHELPLLDPFLLLDDFRSENPANYKAGFPWHPHRGVFHLSTMFRVLIILIWILPAFVETEP